MNTITVYCPKCGVAVLLSFIPIRISCEGNQLSATLSDAYADHKCAKTPQDAP